MGMRKAMFTFSLLALLLLKCGLLRCTEMALLSNLRICDRSFIGLFSYKRERPDSVCVQAIPSCLYLPHLVGKKC
ncbi:hypothetical protein RHMOL_Rhmol07G0249600 [Rhododendron molle]|uniref:Uncharacterized protein n=1 Tax=Rhododendron molle TaxID=49168 RepID=A0ACC0N581_RHOML|nr:hypothetical protein RHMOL_Rhmol07G0249600 [Rhododendron molle]